MSRFVSLKTIQDLKGYEFIIPSMQRGYRWTEANITALLNDLSDFCEKEEDNPIYCLQPLVIKKKTDTNGKVAYRVIDGQQRLTTLLIFRKVLVTGEEDHWKIRYDTKLEETQWLAKLDENSGIDSLDQFCKREAWNTISDYDKKEQIKKLLCGQTAGKAVGFIWYELPEDEDEDEDAVFRRLNSGKISLTASELIKALYMVSGNGLGDMDKMEVAKEWELIESKLRDDIFWCTFNRTKSKTFTRIDMIFNLLVKSENPDDPLNSFYRVESDCKDSIKLKERWGEVLSVFEWMKSVEQDHTASQLMGWLRFFTDNYMTTLCPLLRNPKAATDIISMKKDLWEKIQKTGVIDNFEALTYDTNKAHLQRFFVLFNIALLILNKHGERFSFVHYLKVRKETGWDIEHIDSNTTNAMQNEVDQIEWVLESCAELYSTFENYPNDIKAWLVDRPPVHVEKAFKRMHCERIEFSTFPPKTDNIEFDNVVNIIRMGAKEGDFKNKNTLGNLALLDTNTNRSYGNAIFPVKQRRIRELSQKGGFVPPATKLVFMKYFTTTPTSINAWQEDDKQSYFTAITETIYSIIKELGE